MEVKCCGYFLAQPSSAWYATGEGMLPTAAAIPLQLGNNFTELL
jgi:hypothetical protein